MVNMVNMVNMRGFIEIPIIVIIIFIVGGITVGYQVLSNKTATISTLQTSESSESVTPPVSTPSSRMLSPEAENLDSPSPTSKSTVQNKPTATPQLTVTPTPSQVNVQSSVRIESISPNSGKVGDEFIIKGSGFGKSSLYYPDPTKFQGMISFYGPSGQNSGGAPWGCEWCKDNWSDTQIKARVPGVATGVTFQVEVTSSDGQKSNRVNFRVIE